MGEWEQFYYFPVVVFYAEGCSKLFVQFWSSAKWKWQSFRRLDKLHLPTVFIKALGSHSFSNMTKLNTRQIH
jgi:hypothetical protein